MSILNDFLKVIDFTHSIDDLSKIEYTDIDEIMRIFSSDKMPISSNYADYYQLRKRERDEFWESIDIYIKTDKSDNFLNLLAEFIIEKKLPTKKSLKNFNAFENNEKIFDFQTNNNYNCDINIIKYEDRIVIMLSKFKIVKTTIDNSVHNK